MFWLSPLHLHIIFKSVCQRKEGRTDGRVGGRKGGREGGWKKGREGEGGRERKGTKKQRKQTSQSAGGYNIDEPSGHYAKCNKPNTKVQIFYGSTYTRFLE